jgi:cell division protein FtsZ
VKNKVDDLMESFINNAVERETEEKVSFKVHTPELSKTRDVDAELEEILKKKKATIKVFGIGGAGGNTLMRMSEVGIKGAELIAVNTDAQDLLCVLADKKILIGKELTGGLGAGNNPQIGREAAKESESEIKNSLKEADMAFITCGLGGGTGTGAAPIIAELSKRAGALTVGVVTLPFTIEGKVRQENSLDGLERLQESVDTLIVIPNDKLLEIASDLPLHTAFKVADEILTNAVKGIAELVTKTGLINLDFADIKAVMRQGGVAMIGVGESDTEHRAVEAVEKAITNPLLDVDISGAKGALINVIGGPSMSLEEAKQVVETISEELDDNANVIWGAQLANDMKDSIRVMLVVTGVQSPQIFGKEKPVTRQKRTEIESELGIEFID